MPPLFRVWLELDVQIWEYAAYEILLTLICYKISSLLISMTNLSLIMLNENIENEKAQCPMRHECQWLNEMLDKNKLKCN